MVDFRKQAERAELESKELRGVIEEMKLDLRRAQANELRAKKQAAEARDFVDRKKEFLRGEHGEFLTKIEKLEKECELQKQIEKELKSEIEAKTLEQTHTIDEVADLKAELSKWKEGGGKDLDKARRLEAKIRSSERKRGEVVAEHQELRKELGKEKARVSELQELIARCERQLRDEQDRFKEYQWYAVLCMVAVILFGVVVKLLVDP